jgi:hypothetical protein
MSDCHGEGCHELDALRRDIEVKHQQNRRDIHFIREEQQRTALEIAKLEGKIMPLVDNGQPGTISKMSEKLDQVVNTLTEVRIAQSSAESVEAGRYGEHDWWRTALAPLIVGLALVLIDHFWK